MNRRDWLVSAGCLAGTMAAPGSWAQTPGPTSAGVVPTELEDYVALDRPLAVTLPPGKQVELIEFFWYECPHCNAFEPVLVEWLRTLPPDVAFRHVAVGYSPRQVAAQRLHCALQVTGQAEALHGKVYDAIHRRNRRIDFDWQMGSLVSSIGGDGARLREVLGSPEVAARVQQANALVEAFEVDGVPAFGIQGRYRTSPAMAGSRERGLKVVEALLERARRPA